MAYGVEFDLVKNKIRVYERAGKWCERVAKEAVEHDLVFHEGGGEGMEEIIERIGSYLEPLLGKGNVCMHRVGPDRRTHKINNGKLVKNGAGTYVLETGTDVDYYPVFEVMDRSLGIEREPSEPTAHAQGSSCKRPPWPYKFSEWILVCLYKESVI
jgi:hypothetical protein